MSLDITNILKNKYESENLGHLYIIEPNLNNTTQQSLSWIKKTLSQMLNTQEDKLENIQDLLFINNLDKKQYSSEDLTQIHKFTSYKSVELKRKFLIITDLSMLNTLQSNKLLKTFEEPPIPLTIFLLNDHKTKALNTISSRAITLKIILEKETAKNNLKEYFEQNSKISFESFDKFTTDNYSNLRLCIIDLIELVNLKANQNYSSSQKTLKSLEQDLIYNNSSSHIKLKIFELAKSLVIN